MHEHEHPKLRRFRPDRLVGGVVEEFAVVLGGDDHAFGAELVPAAVELLQRIGAAERIGVRRADEAAWIILLRFLGLVVDEA